MKIFYDTEFLEQGPEYPIELISIGMVREDGKELYLVNMEFNPNKFKHNLWLNHNVRPYLPVVDISGELYWKAHDPLVKTRNEIRDEVMRFVLEVFDPELWAWFSAYDHVVLCQLFGTMSKLPSTFPMWSNDFMQVIKDTTFQLGPNREKHNALSDARWLMNEYERFHA